jgi:hypothetical protein
MTPAETQSLVQELHRVYCEMTRMQIRLDCERERCWFDFIRRGFTRCDLVDMIKELQWGVKNGKRNPGSLKFTNLIGYIDRFEEDLALLRSRQRSDSRTPKPDTNRESALRATGRPAPRSVAAESSPVKPVGGVIPKLIEEMRAAVRGQNPTPELTCDELKKIIHERTVERLKAGGFRR